MREKTVRAGEGIQQGRLLPGQLGRARITVRPGRSPRGSVQGRTPFVVLVVVLLALGLLGLLMLNTALNENSFELAKLQKQTSTLTDQQQALQQEIDRRSAPDALENAARQLGMVPGGDPAFLLDGGKVIGSPGPAKDSPPVKRSDTGLWPGAGQPAAPPAPSPAPPGSPAAPDPAATGEGALRFDSVSPSTSPSGSPSR
ncbi:cell division protein FtsB [Kitasatospora sp. GP30]|uniref:septum formation initiator family protein n=1 Tax=Kitasatospora sp. GP30 TaxID=3035084 RepID=UPI0015D63A76|nr:septum formation initiator family protein [Kitasatospora sp. GP30]MDH6139140.1 cell division protein FtsB [Kitasatospora sp. GP30]